MDIKLTQKERDKILFALPQLPIKEAKKIATVNNCSTRTVYRYWEALKDGSDELNNITIAIMGLATNRLKEIRTNGKKMKQFMRQLSAA